MFSGSEVIVGGASDRDADAELARRHRHCTGSAMGRGGVAVAARKPVLFRLSDRSTRPDGMGPPAEVREVFPAASFPGQWGLGRRRRAAGSEAVPGGHRRWIG